MKKIDIYTDGACSGNPGKGGWGAILIYKNTEKEISGYEELTTNNRMELTAVIRSLLALKEPCDVSLHSDSAYCVNAINNGWLEKWRSFGYKKTANATEQIANVDLWLELDKILPKHNIIFVKVKGHSDNKNNNRCDELARGAIEKNL